MVSWDDLFPVLPNYQVTDSSACSNNEASFFQTESSQGSHFRADCPNVNQLVGLDVVACYKTIIAPNDHSTLYLVQNCHTFLLAVYLGNSIQSFGFHFVAIESPAFRKSYLHRITCESKHKQSFLVEINGHYVERENFEWQR